MKQPELEDFGVSREQYDQYKGGRKKDVSILSQSVGWATSISVFVWLEVGHGWLSAAAEPLVVAWLASYLVFSFGWLFWSIASNSRVNSGDVAAGWICGVFLPLAIPFVVGLLVQWSAVRLKKCRLHKTSTAARIKLYEEAQSVYNVAQAEAFEAQQEADRQRQEAERQRRQAERARQAALLAEQRKREQYWKSLGGREFERELGKLFTARGYGVWYTGGSGDHGGDLILRKDGETTVVQCKAWKNPATPQVARELGGSMMYYKADNGILACTGGFSGGVFEYARSQPITLIDASAISRMAAESGDGMPDMDGSSPVCPVHGCGSDMVLRSGRYGSFWGCSRYPACQGRKSLHATGSLFR